jgi:hypothetical protein
MGQSSKCPATDRDCRRGRARHGRGPSTRGEQSGATSYPCFIPLPTTTASRRGSGESNCRHVFQKSASDLRREYRRAGIADQRTIANDLVNNIVHGVRWHDATTLLKELGCRLFLEMPPGHALTELALQNLPSVSSMPIQAPTPARTFAFRATRASQYVRLGQYVSARPAGIRQCTRGDQSSSIIAASSCRRCGQGQLVV